MEENKSIGKEHAAPALAQRKTFILSLGKEKTFHFDKDRIVLGSVVSADVRLSGDGIAPIHAVIETLPHPTIYDLASETGVFVNGAKVVTQDLKEGDTIQIGRSVLEFKIELPKTKKADDRFHETAGRRLYFQPDEDFSPLLLEDESEIEQIFDFRPTMKQALEVVMSWNDVILNVEHFVGEKAVILGPTRKSHFGIPPLLSRKKHPLVKRVRGEFVLNLDAKMSGVLHRKGKLVDLEDLRAGAASGSHGVEIPLQNDDFVKIEIGEITFYLSFTAAPPRLRMSKLFERDPLFLKVFWTSMVLTAVTVFGLLSANVPQTLEAEQLPERIATILYQPEKYVRPPSPPVPKEKPRAVVEEKKEPEPVKTQAPKPKPTPKVTAKVDIVPKVQPKPKPVPKEMKVAEVKKVAPPAPKKQPPKKVATGPGTQSQAKEGEGAKAKGKEGTRGTPNAPKTAGQPQAQAFRPSPQGGAGRGDGNSQVQDIGNVDILKSGVGRIENILGNSAARLGKGGEKLKGFGGFNTLGTNGLALSGTGKGGGGTADSLGGLSDKGRGGGRVGTGLGAAGNGSGIVGGQSRVVIRSGGPEEAVVMGAIDADAVEAALLAHRDEFRLCYERELNAEHPNMAGRVGTSFVIGSSGRVNQAGIESTSLKNPAVERCILVVIKRVQFPIPRGAGVVQVTYPFKFVATK